MLAAAIGKNWPNKYTNPYSWSIIPKTGHRHMTRNMPPKKAAMPRMRSLREKNRTVRETPMVRVRPVRKRRSPRARRAESKRNSTPRNKKTQPKKSRPVPILVLSDTMFSSVQKVGAV